MSYIYNENTLENLQQNSKVTLLDAINIIKVDDKKQHLTRGQFEAIVDLLKQSFMHPNEYKRKNMKGYDDTIRRYPEFSDWHTSEDKIITDGHNYSNYLYYYTAILCGRFKITWGNIVLYKLLPEVLSHDEIESIQNVAKKLNMSKSITYKVLNIIRRIKICTLKNLNQINLNDIEKYREKFYKFEKDGYRKTSAAWSTIFVLNELGLIDSKEIYRYRNKRYEKNWDIENSNDDVKRLYEDFSRFLRTNLYNESYIIKERQGRFFVEWLYKYYPNMKSLYELEVECIEEYAEYLKNLKKQNGQKYYSRSTINGNLSHLKEGFFRFSKNRKCLKKEVEAFIFGSTQRYTDLYFPQVKVLPKPISLSDREAIENALYSVSDIIPEFYRKMLILLYQVGMRPFELLILKLDCIKGGKYVPQLHIHRAKKFKERYVPLTTECLEIIRYFQEKNKNSQEIFSEVDGLNSRRLFQNKGVITSIITLEENFYKLCFKHGIVNKRDKAKFDLYSLRRLRITLWLESGISPEIVARLVGHSDVDSHNHYIVSKEIRLKNGKKVYDKFYKTIIEDGDLSSINKLNETDEENFIANLVKSLIEIENKTINTLAMESIISEFPEYILPVPCGMCVAKAFENDFECEMMELPCIECNNFYSDISEIIKFDDLVFRIYKNRNAQLKKNLDGLVEKSNFKIERLKNFYNKKLKLNICEIEDRFKNIEESAIIKRGRKKKN